MSLILFFVSLVGFATSLIAGVRDAVPISWSILMGFSILSYVHELNGMKLREILKNFVITIPHGNKEEK